MQHFLRHGMLVLLGTIFMLWANVILARFLSVSDYGDYCIIIRNASFLALILTMGFDVSANRYLSNYFVNGRLHLVKGFLHVCFCSLLIASMVFLGGVVIIALILNYFNVFNIEHVSSCADVIWLSLAIPMAILQLGMVLLRVVHKTDLGFFLANVTTYLIMLLFLCLIKYQGMLESFKMNLALIITSMAYLVSLILIFLATRKHLYMRIKSYGTCIKSATKWRKISRSMMAYSALSVLVSALILNIVELFSSRISEADVGVFALAMTITTAIGLIPSFTVKGSVMAWMKPLFKEERYDELSKLIVVTNWLSIAFNLLVAFLWLWGQTFILQALPSSYHSIIIPGFLLALSFALSPSLNANRSMLMMMGHQNKVLVVRTLNILLIMILVPLGTWYGGIIGASIATISTQLFATIGDWLTLRMIGYGTLWVSDHLSAHPLTA